VNLLGGFSHLLWYVGLVLGVVGVFAFVDAAIRPSGAYVAAGKLTKPAWLAILGVAILILVGMGVLSFFGIFGLVAVLVYLVDVRPAVRGTTGGRGSGRSSSSW